jgi:hypothetical protein
VKEVPEAERVVRALYDGYRLPLFGSGRLTVPGVARSLGIPIGIVTSRSHCAPQALRVAAEEHRATGP